MRIFNSPRKLEKSLIQELSKTYANLTPAEIVDGAIKYPVLAQNLRKYINTAGRKDNHANAIREELKRKHLSYLIN